MKKRKIILSILVLITIITVAAILTSTDNPLERITLSSGEVINIALENINEAENINFNQSLILVNSEHPLETDLEEELIRYENSDRFINNILFESFIELRDYCTDEFETKLKIMSAYRSKERQAEIYLEDTNGLAAKPGESEHETGLGLDVYVDYHAGEAFLKSKAGHYVNENCAEYGFIIRYPKNKKKITGFEFEPWHIRYVGKPHAEIITENGLTLEEYIETLKPDSYYRYKNYIISRRTPSNGMLQIPKGGANTVISPDNCGYFIITSEINR